MRWFWSRDWRGRSRIGFGRSLEFKLSNRDCDDRLVPAGIYAKEVLDHYGLWDRLQTKWFKLTMFALRFALWNWGKSILV